MPLMLHRTILVAPYHSCNTMSLMLHHATHVTPCHSCYTIKTHVVLSNSYCATRHTMPFMLHPSLISHYSATPLIGDLAIFSILNILLDVVPTALDAFPVFSSLLFLSCSHILQHHPLAPFFSSLLSHIVLTIPWFPFFSSYFFSLSLHPALISCFHFPSLPLVVRELFYSLSIPSSGLKGVLPGNCRVASRRVLSRH
jgi:hypothetical protein